MKYKAPEGITSHPAVEVCESAEENGAPDYKHDVFFKQGWVFEEGRKAGCRGCLFETVSDFKNANPILNPL